MITMTEAKAAVAQAKRIVGIVDALLKEALSRHQGHRPAPPARHKGVPHLQTGPDGVTVPSWFERQARQGTRHL
jgi:hypothetical protein